MTQAQHSQPTYILRERAERLLAISKRYLARLEQTTEAVDPWALEYARQLVERYEERLAGL